jgi:3'-phosphoadenosine 5'-phosphosulfate sulfotransferase (PAPS reductase)/FAD synthetase
MNDCANTKLPPLGQEPRIVVWFSCGAASAVAARLVTRHPRPGQEIVVAYCATGAEHPLNAVFMEEVKRWIEHPVTILQSDEYADTWAVWEKRRFLSGIHGAPCTGELKLAPRLAFQRPDDVHVFGYTADRPDVERAKRFRENYQELTVRTPLIDHGITKAGALAMIERAGLTVPPMYALGFQNNNCIPCVKATSPDYWSLVRKSFPQQFERMAKLSRELGARLARINDERVFIDDIPADWPTTNPIAPACDFLCHIAEQDAE